ncbi:MAG: M28 family peptidase [Planctomycetes bacterium]|nr:M28 family peptidase [Planctomycetota bacterium]
MPSAPAGSLLASAGGPFWGACDPWPVLVKLASFPDGRFAGSDGLSGAREYVTESLREAGLRDIGGFRFPYIGWTRGPAAIRWRREDGHLQDEHVIGLPGTPPCEALEAPVRFLGNGTEEVFAAAGKDLRGKWCWVTSEPNRKGRDLHRNEKYCRAVALGAAGFVYERHLPGDLEETGSVGWKRGGAVGAIPAVAITFERGGRIRRAGGLSHPLTMTMRCGNPPQTGEIVHGSFGPSGKNVPLILVGGHLDGHDLAEAAVDNGTGIACVVTLARWLAASGLGLTHEVRFVAWDCEELGLLGSRAYAEAHEADLDRIAVVLNLDVPVGEGAPALVAQGHPELLESLAPLVAATGDVDTSDRITCASDHLPFSLRGVPTLCIENHTSDLRLGRGYTHTRADTLDQARPRALRNAAAFAASVLGWFATRPRVGVRFPPEKVKALFAAGGHEAALRAQGEWPW